MRVRVRVSITPCAYDALALRYDAHIIRSLVDRRERLQIFTKESAETVRRSLDAPVDDVFAFELAMRYLGLL